MARKNGVSSSFYEKDELTPFLRTVWERVLAGDEPGDGVVPYKSAHLDDAESELIVPADHFHVQHPLAVLEVRRILLEHARQGDDGVIPAGGR